MGERFWENKYRTTTICVDSCKEDILSGRFYNPFLKTGEKFQSLMQLLLRMDRLLDQMNFPQTYVSPRKFSDAPIREYASVTALDFRRGAEATFEVRVIFRQHACWQGTISWLEGRREENFRSVLELIQLMDSALRTKKPG